MMLSDPVRTRAPLVLGEVPVTVLVAGYFYAVDLGSDVQPRHHRVAINGECTCVLGRQCSAVDAVRLHLRSSGQRAERPPLGFYPVRPAKCPVCKAATFFDNELSSAKRGAGWQCVEGGKSHYWQHFGWVGRMKTRLARKGRRT